jgi:hypothetical protein
MYDVSMLYSELIWCGIVFNRFQPLKPGNGKISSYGVEIRWVQTFPDVQS